MTRDEAGKILANRLGGDGRFALDWIDAYVALGMLKLDEPKSANRIFLENAGTSTLWNGPQILHALEEAGLKIVPK